MALPSLGLQDKPEWGSGQNIQPGKYFLRILEFKFHTSTDPKKKGAQFFIANFEVLVADLSDDEATPVEAGDKLSWTCNLSQPSGPNNLIQFLLAVYPDKVKADLVDSFVHSLIGPNSPVIGIEMLAKAYLIDTSTGGKFTKVDWRRHVEDAEGEAEPAAEASAQQTAA